jgi:hypothetical protein
MKQTYRGEVILGRWKSCARESGHECAGPHVESLSQAGDGWRIRSQSNECLDKEAGISRRIGQRLQDGALNPGDRTGGRLTHDLPKPIPTHRRRDINNLPDAGGAQPEQHLRCVRIGLRDQRDSRDSREFSNQVSQSLDLVRDTAVHRYENGVDRPLSNDSHRFGYGIPVNQGKAAAASGFDAGPLQR